MRIMPQTPQRIAKTRNKRCSHRCERTDTVENTKYPLPKELLEKRIGYTFKNDEYITTALCHSSYSNEMRSKGVELHCNERLEFLGDSVLSIVTSTYLFEGYKNFLEGELTKIRAATVCEGALFEYANEISLGDYLLLGHGEEISNGRKRKSILSDAFEALIAAIYLDAGMERAREFVEPFIVKKAATLVASGADDDYKTKLQKFIQQNKGDILEYVLVGEAGPAHDKSFDFEVRLNNNVIGKGTGSTKREAEPKAACEALKLFGVM